MTAPTAPPRSSEPYESCGQAAGRTGVRLWSERVAPRDRVECDLPRRLRVEMASTHVRRDRALRNARRRMDRAGCPAPAAATRCDSRRVRRRGAVLRGVGGTYAVVGRLGLRAYARALSDPAPGRLRLRRWAGRAAARRSADQESFPAHRRRLRVRLPCRRPRGDASTEPSRRGERPVSHRRDRPGCVRHPACSDSRPVRRTAGPGGARTAWVTATPNLPASLQPLRAAPDRLPGPVRRGHVHGRVHPVRPRRGPIRQRR